MPPLAVQDGKSTEMARQALSLLGSMYPSLAGLGNQKVSAASAAQLRGLKPLDIPPLQHQVQFCRSYHAWVAGPVAHGCCASSPAEAPRHAIDRDVLLYRTRMRHCSTACSTSCPPPMGPRRHMSSQWTLWQCGGRLSCRYGSPLPRKMQPLMPAMCTHADAGSLVAADCGWERFHNEVSLYMSACRRW